MNRMTLLRAMSMKSPIGAVPLKHSNGEHTEIGTHDNSRYRRM